MGEFGVSRDRSYCFAVTVNMAFPPVVANATIGLGTDVGVCGGHGAVCAYSARLIPVSLFYAICFCVAVWSDYGRAMFAYVCFTSSATVGAQSDDYGDSDGVCVVKPGDVWVGGASVVA